MTRELAEGIVKIMVASYAYDQAWTEDQLEPARVEAWEALELLGVNVEELRGN